MNLYKTLYRERTVIRKLHPHNLSYVVMFFFYFFEIHKDHDKGGMRDVGLRHGSLIFDSSPWFLKLSFSVSVCVPLSGRFVDVNVRFSCVYFATADTFSRECMVCKSCPNYKLLISLNIMVFTSRVHEYAMSSWIASILTRISLTPQL